MKKTFILFLIFTLPFLTLAQSSMGNSIDRLKEETQAIVSINSFLGNASFIHFAKENPLILSGNSPIEKVNAFFDQYEGIFITSDDPSHWIEKESTSDAVMNTTHITLSQHRNNVPVYGSELKFHFDNEMRLTAINGFVYPNITSKSEPLINEDRAKNLAISMVESKYDDLSAELFVNEITLFHYREGTIQNRPSNRDYLVYQAEVKNNSNVREFIFIDAITGKEIESFSATCHSINRRLYDGEIDNNPEWQEGDAIGPLSFWKQREVISSGHAYNFFKNAFGYISIDGNDAQMLIVHDPDGMSCPNANWNGTSINFCEGVGSDDVVAHEWGHAYTQYTSGLIYAWQSGALNEAYSDIWGETIDLVNQFDDDDEDLSSRTTCNSSDKWLIGEDAVAFGGAIRDMWIPNCFGDPGSVVDNNYFCNEGDNGGVHVNSGIINHAYALLVDGGDFNGQTITSLGLNKAAHLFWRVQNTYLSPVSDFAVFASALEASCADLTGVDLEGLSTEVPFGLSGEMIDAMDCDAVAAVIEALALSTPPDCGFMTILDTDPAMLDCMESDTVFYEDFETGMDGWIASAEPVSPNTWDFREWEITSGLPQGRPGSAIFVPNPVIGDCQADLENGIVRVESPLIEIPVMENVSFHIMFRHNIATEPLWDGGNLKYSTDEGASWDLISPFAFTYNGYNDRINSFAQDNNDNPLEGQFAFTGTDEGSLLGSWVESHIELSALSTGSGDNIIFRWELGEDGCNGRHGWYVDDVLVYTCAEEGVGTEDLIPTTQIQISPNPFKNTINIELEGDMAGKSNVEIIDLSGKIVFSKQVELSNDATIVLDELGYLPLGVYVIRFQGENSSLAQKIVKI